MLPPAALIRVSWPSPSWPVPWILSPLVRVAEAVAPLMVLVARLLKVIEPAPVSVAPAAAMARSVVVAVMAPVRPMAPDKVTAAPPITRWAPDRVADEIRSVPAKKLIVPAPLSTPENTSPVPVKRTWSPVSAVIVPAVWVHTSPAVTTTAPMVITPPL